MDTSQSEPASSPSQLRTILTLFIVLRLVLLFFYSPKGLFSAFTDYYFYFQTAGLSEQGYYPFVNMWYEYPPVLAYLPQAAYWLAERILPMGDIYSFGFQLYYRILGVIFLAFEAGALALIQRIVRRAWSAAQANWAAWVYALLGLPLLLSTYAHQAVPLFFWLLAIYCFICWRDSITTGAKPVTGVTEVAPIHRFAPTENEAYFLLSAVALGLGIAAKFTPAILLAPAVKFLWPDKRRIALYSLVMLLTVAAVYLPFLLLGGGEWVLASFRALGSVGSYGTLWAALDGNWGPGSYGLLERRLQLDQAAVPLANPSAIPGMLILALFATLYAVFFFRPLPKGDACQGYRQFIWFSTLTSLIFHLWSKGWSPQWAMMIVPLLLLCFPDRRGLRWALLFTGLIVIEWAVTAAFSIPAMFTFFAALRAAYFVAFAILLIRALWPVQQLTRKHVNM